MQEYTLCCALVLHLPLWGPDPALLLLSHHHPAEINTSEKTAFKLPGKASSQAKATDPSKRSKKQNEIY